MKKIILLPLLLCACGGQGLVARYNAPVPPEKRQADYSECMYSGKKSLASLNNTGTTYMLRALDLLDSCMEQKGYTRS